VSDPPYPNEAVIQPGGTGLDVVSTVRLDQIRTVDRQRLIKRLGKVDAQTMHRVDAAVKISLGLIPL
jgi:mRNA interferase MazF